MSVPMKCRNGHVFPGHSLVHIVDATDTLVIGGQVTCPVCGVMARSVDGTYSFSEGRITKATALAPKDQAIIDAFFRAVRGPDVTREKVEAFKAVAEAVQAGDLSSNEAALVALQIAPSFAELWDWVNKNGGGIGAVTGTLSLLLAIIAMWITITAPDQSSLETRADAAQAHKDAAMIVQASEREHEVQQKIYELLASRQQPEVTPAPPPLPKPWMQKQRPQSPPRQNRHDRRKAASLAKRRL